MIVGLVHRRPSNQNTSLDVNASFVNPNTIIAQITRGALRI